jgi:hypothetical protein
MRFSPRSIELTSNNLQKYCDFLEMSLEGILEEAIGFDKLSC